MHGVNNFKILVYTVSVTHSLQNFWKWTPLVQGNIFHKHTERRCSSICTRAGRTRSLKRFGPTLQVSAALTSGIQVLWSVALSRTVIYSLNFEGRHCLHFHRRIFIFNRVMDVVWIGLILKHSFLLVVLDAFENLWKAIISFVMSVRPSVRMEQLGSHWMGFHVIWYLSSFRKNVENIQVSLKSDNHSAYFTKMSLPRWILLRMRNVSDKFVAKIKTHCGAGQATDDNMVHAHCLLNN
jgi:hypothetical protein